MTKNDRNIVPSQNTGLIQDLIQRVKLIVRLMGDKRVNFFLKLLPVAALAYLVSPVDLVPGLALPVIGALDDAAVIWLGTSLFVTLCPDDVVQEHLNILQKVITGHWRDADKVTDIVETTPAQPEEEGEQQ